MDDIVAQLKPLLLKIGAASLAVAALSLLFRHLRQRYDRKHELRKRPQVGEMPAGEADAQDGTIPLANLRSSVRTWKVSGVEKASGNDATWFIDAESRANAKVKAELKGMIVTAVVREAEER